MSIEKIIREFDNKDIMLLSVHGNSKYQKYAKEYLMNLKGGGKVFCNLVKTLVDRLNKLSDDSRDLEYTNFADSLLDCLFKLKSINDNLEKNNNRHEDDEDDEYDDEDDEYGDVEDIIQSIDNDIDDEKLLRNSIKTIHLINKILNKLKEDSKEKNYIDNVDDYFKSDSLYNIHGYKINIIGGDTIMNFVNLLYEVTMCLSMLNIRIIHTKLESKTTYENVPKHISDEYLEMSDKLEKKVECCICLEKPEEIAITHCGHVYCKSCLETYKEVSNTCAVCRTKI